MLKSNEALSRRGDGRPQEIAVRKDRSYISMTSMSLINVMIAAGIRITVSAKNVSTIKPRKPPVYLSWYRFMRAKARVRTGGSLMRTDIDWQSARAREIRPHVLPKCRLTQKKRENTVQVMGKIELQFFTVVIC